MTKEGLGLGEEYFSGQCAEVAALVPPHCARVLDVGCAFGGLGRGLLACGAEQVCGVELNPAAELVGVYVFEHARAFAHFLR
ncbi:class I SAM-dependent methyltransferase [Rhodocyclus purpureus]|uniref:class I SAM-dependent methyltransferase n=1 Tax=Rhodocyclus purpureus TaxID=1067 RepID=UPI00191455C0|nr:class I SAM-dependent methyltransferase [Rhodocyclus purpureus]